jgi:hypothetical protein
MRRHVVGAFRIMGVIRAFGREPCETASRRAARWDQRFPE